MFSPKTWEYGRRVQKKKKKDYLAAKKGLNASLQAGCSAMGGWPTEEGKRGKKEKREKLTGDPQKERPERQEIFS